MPGTWEVIYFALIHSLRISRSSWRTAAGDYRRGQIWARREGGHGELAQRQMGRGRGWRHEEDSPSGKGVLGRGGLGQVAGADTGRQRASKPSPRSLSHVWLCWGIRSPPQCPLGANQLSHSWTEKGTSFPLLCLDGPSAPSLPEMMRVVCEAQAPCLAGTRQTSCEGANRARPDFRPVHQLQALSIESGEGGQGRNQAKKQLNKRGYVSRGLVNSCRPVWRCPEMQTTASGQRDTFSSA